MSPCSPEPANGAERKLVSQVSRFLLSSRGKIKNSNPRGDDMANMDLPLYLDHGGRRMAVGLEPRGIVGHLSRLTTGLPTETLASTGPDWEPEEQL